MCLPTNVDPTSVTAKLRVVGHGIRSKTLVCALATTIVGLMAAAWPSPARAVDGCLVLLCFAAPSWRSIPQCVPPIREVLRDLARGRAFPTCGMSGPGNSASHQWASAPAFCPPQYTRVFDGPTGQVFSCDYSGAVTVTVDGTVWARAWWGFSGDTATDFTPAAKAQLGSWDNKFDTDYASWLASLPPPAPPCPTC